jgi:hypothetical protein
MSTNCFDINFRMNIRVFVSSIIFRLFLIVHGHHGVADDQSAIGSTPKPVISPEADAPASKMAICP